MEYIVEGGHDAGTGGTEGVTQGNAATVDIDFLVVDTQFLIEGHGNHGKSFVHLEVVDIVFREAGPLQSQWRGLGGRGCEPHGIVGSIGKRKDTCHGSQSQLFHFLFAYQHQGGSTIVDGGSVGSRYRAVFGKGRTQGRYLFEFNPLVFFVFGNGDRVSLALGDHDRYDFFFKDAFFGCFGGALIRADRVFILCFPADLVFSGGIIGANTHGYVVIGISEAVFGKAVYHFGVPVFAAPAGTGHVVGNVRHAFHATGNYQVIVTEHNALCTEHNGFHTGRAHFIHGGTWHILADAGTKSCLAGRGLTEVGGNYITHEYFLDLIGGNTRFFEGSFDGSGPQVDGAKLGEHTTKTSQGGTDGGGDEYFFHVLVYLVRLWL